MNPRSSRPIACLAALGLGLTLVACQTTRQVRHVEESGFLGDYSQLKKGTDDEALLVYIDPNAHFGPYDSIMIDSVTFWHDGKTKVSVEDQQMLTDLLYAAMQKDFEASGLKVVEVPGPTTLRLRAAITQAKGAHVIANVVTSVVPQTRLLGTLIGLASDTAILVGEAAVEVEVTDSLTGKRLAAAVDERIGTKTIRAAFGKWTQVEDAFDYWAKKMSDRVESLKADQP